MHPDSALVLALIQEVLGPDEAERIFWLFAGLVTDDLLMTRPAVTVESCVHQYVDLASDVVIEHWYYLDEKASGSGHHHLLVAVVYPDGDTYRSPIR